VFIFRVVVVHCGQYRPNSKIKNLCIQKLTKTKQNKKEEGAFN